MKPVAVAPRNKIITFVAYINYRNNHGTPIGNDYLSVTEAQYDNFRCTEYLRSGNSDLSYPDVNTRIMLKGINPTPKQDGIMDISDTYPIHLLQSIITIAFYYTALVWTTTY